MVNESSKVNRLRDLGRRTLYVYIWLQSLHQWPPSNNPTVLVWFLFWGGTSHVCLFFFGGVHFFSQTRRAQHQFFIPFFIHSFIYQLAAYQHSGLLLVASSNYWGVKLTIRPFWNKWPRSPISETRMAVSITDACWKNFVHGQFCPARPKNHWTNSNTGSLV